MQYFETQLTFNELPPQERVVHFSQHTKTHHSKNAAPSSTEILGIKVRIGNQPLVYNLKKLAANKNSISSAAFPTDPNKEYYLIVHSIGAIRTQGSAKVEELQYFAEASECDRLQTIDLIPNSRFKEVLKVGLTIDAALSVNGEASFNIPIELTENLIPQLINMGGNMQLHLSASADFVGKFSFSIQLPVVQASGIASNACAWILNPDEKKTPLLGDQLLVQTIAVPKHTKLITYKLSGHVKADKGLFWKQQQQKTPDYMVAVSLD